VLAASRTGLNGVGLAAGVEYAPRPMPTSRQGHHRREVSRIEGFSDAVFAFAITLLVVSLEVPKTFAELLHAMRGFPAFAVSFALLFQIWWRHYSFFRSYDLEDAHIISLTGVLLFVVLFFVYPLKFLWSLVFAPLQGRFWPPCTRTPTGAAPSWI
jgi:hypothetical protein